MSGETKVTIFGNITADPELRYTQNGLAVANFTIASTPRVFNRATNEWEDSDTLYLRGTIWRDYAEHVCASLKKGAAVIAHGTLRQRTYQTKPTDGSAPENRTAFELEVDEVGPSLRYAKAEVSRVVNVGTATPEAWASVQAALQTA